MKFPGIILVIAIEKYKLHVRFSDASEGEYDVSHLAGKGVFKSWIQIIIFLKFLSTLNPAPLHGWGN